MTMSGYGRIGAVKQIQGKGVALDRVAPGLPATVRKEISRYVQQRGRTTPYWWLPFRVPNKARDASSWADTPRVELLIMTLGQPSVAGYLRGRGWDVTRHILED